nr:hypothetical protein HmN_000364100 [Hymenolepis microstoma]
MPPSELAAICANPSYMKNLIKCTAEMYLSKNLVDKWLAEQNDDRLSYLRDLYEIRRSMDVIEILNKFSTNNYSARENFIGSGGVEVCTLILKVICVGPIPLWLLPTTSSQPFHIFCTIPRFDVSSDMLIVNLNFLPSVLVTHLVEYCHLEMDKLEFTPDFTWNDYDNSLPLPISGIIEPTGFSCNNGSTQ